MKGILFKPWKVELISQMEEGETMVTRRVITEAGKYRYEPTDESIDILWATGQIKPRYKVGEVVYVKEAWWEDSGDIYYKMDCPTLPMNMYFEKGKWKSPLFMPEWAARYFIKVLDVRPERLQEITGTDCLAEGISPCRSKVYTESYKANDYLIQHYANLWDSLNPKYPWESNPWAWRYEFRRGLK